MLVEALSKVNIICSWCKELLNYSRSTDSFFFLFLFTEMIEFNVERADHLLDI